MRPPHSDSRKARESGCTGCRYDVGANLTPRIDVARRRVPAGGAGAGTYCRDAVAPIGDLIGVGRSVQRLWRSKNSQAMAVASISVVVFGASMLKKSSEFGQVWPPSAIV